jgi:hypothetical protein
MKASRLLVAAFTILALATSAVSLAWSAPAYPLHVSNDGRYVMDQGGKKIFFNMESAWFLLTRLTREEVIQYFDNRKAKGFNACLIMFPMPEWGGVITNRYGEAPFLAPGDFSQPNDAYFAHGDWVVEQARARGLTLFLAPAYLGWECVNDGFCDEMRQAGVDVMRNWGRWIGNRYRDRPNIVWVNGGDADAADQGVLDLVDAVALGIREVDPDHLQTAHCNRYHSAAECYDRPWLDINTTYSDCIQTPRQIRIDYQRPSPRPFVFIEGRYEFEYDWTDVCMRSQAYWTLLGGAAGNTFGSGIVHTFTNGWQDAMESEGSVSMDHFGDLLRSRRWDLLVPDFSHTVLTSGYGDISTPDYAPAARTSDGNTVIVYVPTRRTLTIAMDQISGTSAVAWWYNPTNGQPTQIGSYATTGSKQFTPPTSEEWVLVLDNALARVAPPGQGVPVATRSWSSLKLGFRRE